MEHSHIRGKCSNFVKIRFKIDSFFYCGILLFLSERGNSQLMVNKVMTWVLIMTLLVSQSYAYASVPCEANGGETSQHNNDMSSMDHSLPEHDMSSHMQHNMLQEMQQQEFSMDCCDEECSCPTGTCSSVTLTHFMTVSALSLVSDSSDFYLFSIQDTFLPSLRKPPIIS